MRAGEPPNVLPTIIAVITIVLIAVAGFYMYARRRKKAGRRR